MKVYKILLPININEPFDYISGEKLQRGEIVHILHIHDLLRAGV